MGVSGRNCILIGTSMAIIILLLTMAMLMRGGTSGPEPPTPQPGIRRRGDSQRVWGANNNNRPYVRAPDHERPRTRWSPPPNREFNRPPGRRSTFGDSTTPLGGDTEVKDPPAPHHTPEPPASPVVDDKGLTTPPWLRPSNPQGETQQKNFLKSVPHCTYEEESMVPGMDLEDATSFKEWNHYVANHTECQFRRDLVCSAPGDIEPTKKPADEDVETKAKLKVKTNIVASLSGPPKTTGKASKGRALVLMMIGGFDPEDATSQWGNIDYFLKKGYMLPEVETKLFDGVDYVVYRSHPDVTEITPCAQHGNLLMVWVQPARCDLCAHAKLLQWLGYSIRFSKVVPDEEFIANSWPYKSIILLNSGIRGPIQHEASGSWVDSVSMAGEKVRPLHMKDDWMFTTVAGSRFNKEKGYKNTPYQLHLQSYFLVIPLSALGYFYNLFYNMGCTGPIDFPELPGKWACIFRAELQTLLPFVNPATNGLEMLDKTKRREKFYRSWDAYAFGTKTKYDPSVPIDEFWEKDSSRKSQLWNDYMDPCQAIFVKFGGEVYLYQGPYVHQAVNSLTRFKMLQHKGTLNKGIADLLFGTADQKIDNSTTMWWNKIRQSRDEDVMPKQKCEMLNEIAMGLGKKWERPSNWV